MSDDFAFLFTIFLTGSFLMLAGWLLLWLARRSGQGLLKRNPIAGVRTALTLSSDAAWYPAQRAAAPKTRVAAWGTFVGGAALVALGLLGLLLGANMLAYMVVYVVVFAVLSLGSAGWLLVWVLAGAGDAQRAARDAVAHA
ncbi:SdpI family protein [Salinibacterium amurskyense]|uniref:SdpI family protein n=1 Tax=Salinibacterium amurskyense TaxID=205941 RepID=UPI00311E7091